MPLVLHTRRSASAVLDRGRSAATATPTRAAHVAGHTLTRAGRVVGSSQTLVTSASSSARKQVLAGLGLTDAVTASVIKRGAELPTDLKQGGAALASTLTTSIGSARTSVVNVLRTATLIPANAVDARNKLAQRGAQVATDLRHDPVLVQAITTVDGRVEKMANDVTSVAQKVRSRVAAQADQENAAATSTPVRLPPAKKVPSHKTTVRKTPAGQAPVSVIPTHRAAAQEDQVRADAAAKAAETRRRAALAKEEAADARKAAAVKAAATRKENAELAEAKRHATAAKAAATRKKNAAKAGK